MLKENKWYIYQKERFPIAMYIPMVAAFSFSAVSYSSIVRGGRISVFSAVVACVTSLTTFMLLRIADEHKDFEEDSLYRPYRPVPRGLITLKELRVVAGILMAVQAVLALALSPPLMIPLLVVWAYFFGMTYEFFCKEWLKARPVVYMISHMFIMPLLDFYEAACDFSPNNAWYVGPMLMWFISSSFFDGAIVEVGRKMRAPQDEETGVQTYSVLWGRKVSVLVWCGCMFVSMGCTFVATGQLGAALPAMMVLPVVWTVCTVCAVRYARKPTTKNASLLETLSGIWTVCDYLALGILPLLVVR